MAADEMVTDIVFKSTYFYRYAIPIHAALYYSVHISVLMDLAK